MRGCHSFTSAHVCTCHVQRATVGPASTHSFTAPDTGVALQQPTQKFSLPRGQGFYPLLLLSPRLLEHVDHLHGRAVLLFGRRVIQLGVLKHEPEVCPEVGRHGVLAVVHLPGHSPEIHRRLDNVKVVVQPKTHHIHRLQERARISLSHHPPQHDLARVQLFVRPSPFPPHLVLLGKRPLLERRSMLVPRLPALPSCGSGTLEAQPFGRDAQPRFLVQLGVLCQPAQLASVHLNQQLRIHAQSLCDLMRRLVVVLNHVDPCVWQRCCLLWSADNALVNRLAAWICCASTTLKSDR
mmetsp:Transcript_20453/g.41587  ORF Transcript_20453/g.41587 Transcript_20453/m.41587 type:complete len:295 (-) Transcript_20453:3581-4465(-)